MVPPMDRPNRAEMPEPMHPIGAEVTDNVIQEKDHYRRQGEDRLRYHGFDCDKTSQIACGWSHEVHKNCGSNDVQKEHRAVGNLSCGDKAFYRGHTEKPHDKQQREKEVILEKELSKFPPEHSLNPFHHTLPSHKPGGLYQTCPVFPVHLRDSHSILQVSVWRKDAIRHVGRCATLWTSLQTDLKNYLGG